MVGSCRALGSEGAGHTLRKRRRSDGGGRH
jgi:hypothetical protein